MHSRWFSVAVVVLWLTSMGWLVGKKVLPSLWVGDPPDSRTILAARLNEPLVGWTMYLNSQRMGWALNSLTPLPTGMTKAHSRVHFEGFPLSQSAPDWLHTLVGHFGGQFQMELASDLEYDTLGRLSAFRSAARFPPLEEAAIKVTGIIDGAQMQLTIRSGNTAKPYETQLAAPRNSMLNDGLSPQTRLPGLREGQSWTIEVYSPLQPPNPNSPQDPREILLATVEGREPVFWAGKHTPCWVVVYRSDSATAAHQSAKPVGKVWVRPDGLILKQQVSVFGATVSFVRLTEAQALSLAHEVHYQP